MIRLRCAGQIYSLNDARYPDWPDGLKRYIDDVRAGRGQSGKQYSARYVCSLVSIVTSLTSRKVEHVLNARQMA